MAQYPEQLDGEPDASYAHFCAWIDFPESETRGATARFAALRGVRPDHVRRMRSRYRWKDRTADRPSADAQIRQATNERLVEKTADRRAELRTTVEMQHAYVSAQVGKLAIEAVKAIDITQMDQAGLVQFVTMALKRLGPATPAAVAIAAQQTNVSGEIAQLAEMPPAAATARAREIAAEAVRKIDFAAEYERDGNEFD